MITACLLIPHFRIKSEIQRHEHLSSRQLLITRFNGTKEQVVDYANNIDGIAKGSLLKDVLSKIENPILLKEDEKYYSEVQKQILGKLLDIFGSLEVNGYECIYIDTSNACKKPSDTIEIAKIIFSIIPKDFTPKLGFSTGKYSSYAAALMSSLGHFNILKCEKKHISKLSIEALPISDELKKRMCLFGLRNFKKIANLKREYLFSQFGEAGKFIWDFANGIDESRITPLQLRETFSKVIEFCNPTDNYDSLLVAIESLILKAFAFLEDSNKYPRKISMTCCLSGGAKWVKSITFKTHNFDKNYANSILKKSLLSYDFSGPVERIQIEMDDFDYNRGFQLELFSKMYKDISLKESIHQFKSRFDSESPIYRVRKFEPHSRIPERRYILVRYDP